MQLHADIYFWCAFQVFVLFKLISNTALQSRARRTSRRFEHPEDQLRVGSPRPDSSSEAESLRRATRLWANDLENLIPFSLIALAGAFCGIDGNIYLILICFYALSRIVHAVCLTKGFQPYRTLTFILGLAAMIAMAVLVIVRLFLILPTL